MGFNSGFKGLMSLRVLATLRARCWCGGEDAS